MISILKALRSGYTKQCEKLNGRKWVRARAYCDRGQHRYGFNPLMNGYYCQDCGQYKQEAQ